MYLRKMHSSSSAFVQALKYFLFTATFLISTSTLVLAEENIPEKISSDNWEQKKDFLLEPLARIISEAKLSFLFDTSFVLPFEYDNIESVDDVTDEASYELLDDGMLKEPVVKFPVFSIDNLVENEQNAEIKALRIYWNTQSVINPEGGFIAEYQFDIDDFSTGDSALSENINFKGVLGKNKRYEEKKESNPAMRDEYFWEFLSPGGATGLTHHFEQSYSTTMNGNSNYRIFSPVLSECRKLHLENFDDEILKAPVSVRDLHFFNESPIDYNIEFVKEKTIFVPREQLVERKKDSNSLVQHICKDEVKIEEIVKPILLEYKPYQNSSGEEVPVFSVDKEEVWILKVSSKSPLHESGYSYYFVGKQTLLPYYKISFNYVGKPLKFIIASWIRGNGNDKLKKPVMSSLKAFDLNDISKSVYFKLISYYQNDNALKCINERYIEKCN